jgi:hypothetical protein
MIYASVQARLLALNSTLVSAPQLTLGAGLAGNRFTASDSSSSQQWRLDALLSLVGFLRTAIGRALKAGFEPRHNSFTPTR